MGLIDIGNDKDESQGKTYLSFLMCDEMLKLQVVKFAENPVYFLLNISKESTVVKKWSQNLQQSPEKYLNQLYDSLQAKALEDEESTDLIQSKSIFEVIDDNLVWRQYFCDKKMFGRRGKFTLEKVENRNFMEEIMDYLVKDIKLKDKTISDLEKQNKLLISEKNELLLIAEKGVKMKEDLEKKLYEKFSTLLNTKKTKLSQYRKKYEMRKQSELCTSHSRSGQSVENIELSIPETSNIEQQSTTTCSLSDDDYDDDTDVDSHEEVDHHDRLTLNQKRKNFSPSGNNFSSKKTKSAILPLDESQDLLNASLEMELNSVEGKNNFIKFKKT